MHQIQQLRIPEGCKFRLGMVYQIYNNVSQIGMEENILSVNYGCYRLGIMKKHKAGLK